MSSKQRVHEASQLLEGFAERTGIKPREDLAPARGRRARRYLWTDAFAVSGFVTLWRETGERRYMALAGFNPEGAPAVWENMIRATGGNRPPAWLSTHPDPASRVKALRASAPGLMPS